MRHCAIIHLISLLLPFAVASSALAEKPLLQEGKKTVFQRVVSHPGAMLYADASTSQPLSSPRTFTSFYVYGTEGDMIRVGASTSKADGWLKLAETTNWPTAVTMVFTDRTGRQPVLFFKDHDAIIKLCSSDNLPDIVRQYATLFATPNARKPTDLPVAAVEPFGDQGQAAQNSFYLLPVLDVDTRLDVYNIKLLNVAYINPGIQEFEKNFSGTGDGNATLPQVVNAWIADTDLTSVVQNEDLPPVIAAEPAVLLTKMQLGRLREQLKQIIGSTEETFINQNVGNFYDQLISAAARISVDPDGFSREPDTNPVQKGVLLELLDNLPYSSFIMRLSREDWITMSSGEFLESIRRLKSLVRRYEEYDRDNTLWEGFGSSDTNNWVLRLPFSEMP